MSRGLEFFSRYQRACLSWLGTILALGGGPALAQEGLAPHLSMRRPDRAQPEARLVLEGGPAHGTALFFCNRADAAQELVPQWLRRLHGLEFASRPYARAACDERGRASLELTTKELAQGWQFQVLLLPAGGSLIGAQATSVLAPVTLDETGEHATSSRVIVTEFLKDPTAVGDTAGEWIELFNPGSAPVDIAGWVLSDLGGESTVLANSGLRMVVPPHRHIVLARNADPATNGGVPVDYTYLSFSLSNSDDEIQLTRPDGSLVDLVAYDDGVLWPDVAGRSISLDPFYRDEVLNNDPVNWCHSLHRLHAGSTDTGTPGKRNEDCP